MSRRKQPKPQHVLSDHYLPFINDTEDVHLETATSIDSRLCVCSRCCAEFSEPSCLERHQRECSPNQLVMIVNENEDLFSRAELFPSASSSPRTQVELGERVKTFKMEECAASVEEARGEMMDCSVEKNVSNDSSSQNRSCNCISAESIVDHVLCASVQTSPQPGNQSEQEKSSWLSSDVIIEHLEGTKVAVAQFSKQFHSDVTSFSNNKTAVSSLVEQLLALQLQQIQQLQLIDEIRHQVLLFDSERLQLSDSSLSRSRDNLSSKRANQPTTFSSNLSQELTRASDTAQSLASQSASIVHLKQSKVQFSQSKLGSETELCSREPLDGVGKPKTLEVGEHFPEKQSTDSGDCYTKMFFSCQRNMSSLVFRTGSLKDGSDDPQLAQVTPVSRKGSRSFSAVEADMTPSATLAKQRKFKATHSLERNTCSKEILFKHKCRFCAKVFGSDSALQIHVRSHTGERPYQCNVCGNRFSTRGNLKVHFQRHKDRYPHIQMNPYPVPEHLDNVQTNYGSPHAMSMPPARPLTCWLDSKRPLSSMGTSGLMLPLTNLTSHMKKERQPASPPNPSSPGALRFNVTAKSVISMDVSETGKGSILTVKREDGIPSFNPSSKMTLPPDGSSSPLPKEVPPIEMHLTNSGLSTFEETHPSQTSETSNLQQLVENLHDKATDPNECVICHRILGGQGTLRMHYCTHTGERPYSCNEYGRAFSTKGNLKMHRAVHRSAPPMSAQHSCPICHRKFTSAVPLRQHIRMHMAGEFPNIPIPSSSFAEPMDGGLRDDSKWNCQDTLSGGDKDVYGSHIVSMAEYDCLSTSSSENIGAGSISALLENRYSDSTGAKQCSCVKTDQNEELHEENSQACNCLFLEDDQSGEIISAFKNPNMDHFNTAGINSSPTHLSRAINLASSDHKLHNPLKDTTHSICEQVLFKNLVCDICGKTFGCHSALDIHYRSHTKERPFICTECHRGFSTKGNLKQHMLTHQMRDLPPQLFEPSKPSLLSSPKAPVHPVGAQKIKTELTGFLSASHGDAGGDIGSPKTSSVSLSPAPAPPQQRRMAKQHYCHTCGKAFSSSSALQIHERTHTGEKPFACSVCGRAFTTKGNLKVHMGTHMWSSGPTRRGRRLSIDGTLALTGSRLEKFPGPPEKSTESVDRDSIYQGSHCAEPFSRGSSTDDITVMQNGRTNVVWDKRHHTDPNSLLEMYESSNIDQKNPFCFRRPVKKDMVAN